MTCKKLGQHQKSHQTLESLILEMARDALAIPIANNSATAAMCDEKLSEIPDNLHSTIPIKPLSNVMRSFGDRSKFDIAS